MRWTGSANRNRKSPFVPSAPSTSLLRSPLDVNQRIAHGRGRAKSKRQCLPEPKSMKAGSRR